MKKKATLVSVISFVLAVVCLIAAIKGCVAERQAGREYESLLSSESIQKPVPEPADTPKPSPAPEVTQPPAAAAETTESVPAEEIPVREDIDFTELQKRNPDIYAWISIPETNVDYPIVQHPTDNSYYLEHTIDHQKTVAASIYTELYNEKDFSDHHTVIYGHNMKNGTMFKTLHNFADAEFFDANRDIYVYLPEETRHYKVFAAYTYDNRHLLNNYYCEEPEYFQKYLDEVFAIRDFGAHIDKDMEVTGEDYVITLSTCVNSGNSSQRYLVQAVLVSIN